MASAANRVRIHSPLALIGAFIQVYQEIFDESQGMHWVWYADDSRRAPTGRARIFINSAFNANTEVPNSSARIAVNRGSVVFSNPVVGNTDQNNEYTLSKGYTYSYFTAEVDIQLKLMTETAGECAQLSDLVNAVIIGTQQRIGEAYTLTSISPTVMSSIVPERVAKEMWTCTVDFRVRYEARFFTAPVLVPLTKIAAQIDEKHAAEQLLINLALGS